MKQVTALFLLMLLVGCKAPINHQARVWLGLGITEDCTSGAWKDGLALLKEDNVAGLMLDLSLDSRQPGPAAGYQYYLPHPLDSVIQQLRKYKLPYGIRIIWKQDSTPISDSRLTDWFTDLSGLLLRSSKYPPEWIMFQGEWTKKSWHEGALNDFIGMVKPGWKEFDGKIWLAGKGRSPIFSPKKEDKTADGWVYQVEGFTDETNVSQLRSSTGDQTNAATNSMRILSIAPAWSGFYWRIEQWLTKGEELVSVSDLYLSGEECGISLRTSDLEKMIKLLSSE